jgi:hypothetical protein
MALFSFGASRARVRELEDRLDTVERQLRKLDAEFSDLLDRVNRQVARLVKRDQREAPESPEETRTDPGQGSLPFPLPGGVHTRAYERAKRAGLVP